MIAHALRSLAAGVVESFSSMQDSGDGVARHGLWLVNV
jgi:hypothetical protein